MAASDVVNVAEAARIIGRSVSTIQGWIRDGAPTVDLGSCGRGRSSRVIPRKLLEWRAGRLTGGGAVTAPETGDLLRRLATTLWRLHVKPSAEGRRFPNWKLYRVPEGSAAALAVDTYQAVHRELAGRFAESEELPAEMRNLLGVYLDSLHHRTQIEESEP